MTYPGGKNGDGVYQRIINHIPPHERYIEAFLGGGAIMRMKKPAACSIGIDADGDVLTTFSGDGISNLTLIHADAIVWLATHATDGDMISPNTLVYLDPPYVMSTRRQHRPIYRYELSEADHICLLEIAKILPCMVIISGYWSELYAKALIGWSTDHFIARTRGGAMATEWLWMNYPEPLELHDYRYLGTNFRERERIHRKIKRWKNRLIAMDSLEKHAIMAAIDEIKSTSFEKAMTASIAETGVVITMPNTMMLAGIARDGDTVTIGES